MATSKHLAIRDAVAALYAAATALAGGRIHENRDLPLREGVVSHIQVFRVDSDPERLLVGGAAPIDWSTQIRTRVKARKDGTTSAETAADEILTACFARVMADQTLGGLAMQVEPGAIAWDQDEADSTVVMADWDFTVSHRTETNVIS